MAYVVKEAPDGLCVDTASPITPELAQKIASTTLMGQRIRGVAQYVGIHDNGPNDINHDRLVGILGAGLGLWLVQHPYFPGWEASAELGMQMGAAARRNACLAGYASGACLALDLEGCKSSGQAVIDYVNAWVEQVRDEFEPLLYVGFECGLTPQQLYESLPGVHKYWSDFGSRQVSTRGFCVVQHRQTSCCGVLVDPDTTQSDLLGARLLWMIDDAIPAPSDRETAPELPPDDAA